MAVVTVVATLEVSRAVCGAVPCAGDCNADGDVTVEELQIAVTIALGAADLGACPSLDNNADGLVTVDELLAAVSAALNGCSPTPATPTPGPGCGDGITTGQEECDDGNRQDGDGCSADCVLETGGDVCTGVPTHPGALPKSALVASGLSAPLYVTAAPRDVSRIFVVEQTGQIRIVKWGTLLEQPFVDLTARVSCCGERGLLSMAFHPHYATNGLVFVDYTDTAGNTVVSRWHVSPDADRLDPDSEEIILHQQQPFANHNGGLVAFGPDGYLYIGLGDGGSAGDPQDNGQNLRSWLGKLLRIDVNGPLPYTVPPDNPFVGGGEALGEIWAFGLRNPWRFSFDRTNGDLYIADVGQNQYEEIDLQPAERAGVNYGWHIMEGAHCFKPPDNCPMAGLTLPVVEYGHDQGCSVTGGAVYRGCALPDLHGTYFYADYCTNFVRSFVYASGTAINPRDWTADLTPPGADSFRSIASFGEDARGELYICDLSGAVYKIVPADSAVAQPAAR